MLYLIDSSAVLNDFGFEFRPEHSYITTPLVISEFKDMRSRNLMENALQHAILSIREPEKETTNYVEDTVAEKGFTRLSRPDKSLLALGLDLKKAGKKFTLVTDDFSIQNFCSVLKIPFQDAIRGKIEREISFSLECPSCGKTLKASSTARKCPDCGSSLRRKRVEN